MRIIIALLVLASLVYGDVVSGDLMLTQNSYQRIKISPDYDYISYTASSAEYINVYVLTEDEFTNDILPSNYIDYRSVDCLFSKSCDVTIINPTFHERSDMVLYINLASSIPTSAEVNLFVYTSSSYPVTCSEGCPIECDYLCTLNCTSSCPVQCSSDCPLTCASACPLNCSASCPYTCDMTCPFDCEKECPVAPSSAGRNEPFYSKWI